MQVTAEITGPATVNGHPVLREHHTPTANGTRAGRVILVDRSASADHRYVTAWQGQDDGRWDTSWCWGHYIESLASAEADFNHRAARGF